jgi:isoleucyl-tRNA synthetase
MAALKLRDFADVLTNWYVRRSRERFWDGTDTDAFDTLYTVLETVTRVAAPLIPLIAEEIWQGLTGGRSVHLEDWPDAELFPADDALERAMDAVREVASAGLALRKSRGLRVRLPLATLTVVIPEPQSLAGFTGILQDELNIKSIAFAAFDDDSVAAAGITRKLTVNARAVGPRLGKNVQSVIQSAKAGDWAQSGESVIVGGIELLPGEFELELESADDTKAIEFLASGGFVALDTTVTAELKAEGLARDVIRAIQDTRKSADLKVSDRIRLSIIGSVASDVDALTAYGETIGAETLAVVSAISFAEDPESAAAQSSAAGSQRTTLSAGQYSNEGVLVIDVWKSEVVDV